MLGICRSRPGQGFSLVEIVVVLLLLGLVSGIAVPRLTSLFNSLQTQNQINAIRHQVQAAPLQAYLTGREIDLAKYLLEADVVPTAWELILPEPILIRANGICLGGTMQLRIKNQIRHYQISVPFCRVESA